MPSPSRFLITRHFLLVIPLSLIAAIPISIIKADDAQSTAPAAPAVNPNAATQPSDLELDKYGWTKDTSEACHRMMELSRAIWIYSANHNDHYPSDLGSLLGRFKTPRDGAESCLTPGDQRRVTIPDHPSAAWVDQNASYIYLAARLNQRTFVNPADGKSAAIWGATVMLHTRLDQPFTHPKVGDVIILTFIDGHTELFPIAEARKVIEASKKAIAAGHGSP